MITATHADKPLVVGLLSESFDSNKSINYIVKQDSQRKDRIKTLMEYSFDICVKYGHVLLTDDKEACALLLFPDKKKASLRTLIRDLRMVIRVSEMSAIKKIIQREKRVKANYPTDQILYLWFICVSPKKQRKGIGKRLLNDVIDMSQQQNRPIYLETSMIENLIFYKKMGFEIYTEIDFSYRLFLLRRNV